MSLYYFHLTPAQYSDRVSGVELANLQQAKTYAVKLMTEDLAQTPDKLWTNDGYSVTVSDERGLHLFTLDISATLAPVLYPTKPRA